jgi:hypothetical protein
VIRRTIPEIVAKYKLNPRVRDVYVEGAFDRKVLRWFFDEIRATDVGVFEITLIDIPSSLLRRHGLGEGERSRVIALGRELARLNEGTGTQAICVVDADYDRILQASVEGGPILLTDYTCMEMYFVYPSVLAKYFRAVLGVERLEIDVLLRNYSTVLRELYLIRAANQALSLALRWIPFDKACRKHSGVVVLDRELFTTFILQDSQVSHRHGDLLAKIEELRPRLDSDLRNHANGHDFLALLSIDYGREAKRSGLPNVDAIASALRACLDIDRLAAEPLFQQLRGLAADSAGR